MALSAFVSRNSKRGFISLFDGKTLNNWKVGNNSATLSVTSGMIMVQDATAHLFYEGDLSNHNF